MFLRPCLIVLILLSPAPTLAEQVLQSPEARVSLLELYTSEGCSSCPPADRWLSTLKDDPRLWRQVVPVAFHVDYWNYLGWEDRFADPGHGDRQRRYARQGAIGTVYTPGLVLDGREWRGWFARPELELEKAAPIGRLRAELDGDRARIVFTPVTPAATETKILRLHLAVLGFGLSTRVESGENRGRTLAHDFVVLGYGEAPVARNGDAYEAVLELPGTRFQAPRKGLALWLTRNGEPQPVQALGGWLD